MKLFQLYIEGELVYIRTARVLALLHVQKYKMWKKWGNGILSTAPPTTSHREQHCLVGLQRFKQFRTEREFLDTLQCYSNTNTSNE